MGMIVPMSPGQKPNAPAQAMPSQTELLMAVSEMHKQGRFTQNQEGLADSGWDTLSKDEQEQMRSIAVPGIEGSGFNNRKELEELIDKSGVVEIDPRNTIAKDIIKNPPQGVERFNLPEKTMYLTKRRALTS